MVVIGLLVDDEYQIYKNRSIELVLARHPSFTLSEAVPVAKAEFEASARALWLETLALAKAMRPKGRWGWYNFAHCSNCRMQPQQGLKRAQRQKNDVRHPLGLCPVGPLAQDYNHQMMWLYTETTALFPSIYLPCPPPSHHPSSVPEWCSAKAPAGNWNSTLRNIAYVDCQMDAAQQVASAVAVATGGANRPDIYAFAWMDYYPPNDNLPTGLFVDAADVATQTSRPSLWGAAGSIVWGASEDTYNNSQCNGPASLGAFINATAGPIIRTAVDDAATCSRKRCNGQGRCVSLPKEGCSKI